jgi:hypothetical protein
MSSDERDRWLNNSRTDEPEGLEAGMLTAILRQSLHVLLVLIAALFFSIVDMWAFSFGVRPAF